MSSAPMRAERLLVPTLVLLASSTAVVASLGAPLVPQIAAAQHVSLSDAQWVLTVTFLTGAVVSPLLGRLGGGRQRRPVVLVGAAAVFLGCVLAALPLGFGVMVVGRVLQGFGLGLTPLVIAIARDTVPEDRRAAAMATLSMTTVAGAGLGYPLAALVVEGYGVAAAYWVGAAITGTSLVCAAVVVPEDERAQTLRLDLVGALLLAAGAGGLLLAVSRAPVWAWTSVTTIAVAGGSLAALVTWVSWTLVTSDPVVDLRLATRHGVLGANLTALLAGCSMYMFITLVILMVQAPPSTGFGLGESVALAGTLLLPFSLASVLGSRMTRPLVRSAGEDALLAIGCGLFAVATLVLVVVPPGLTTCAVAMTVGGLGSGCSFAAMPGLLLRFVPSAETSSAMGFNHILRYLGFATGSALALALLQLSAAPDGSLTRGGFTTAALASSAVSVFAAVTTLWLARSVPAAPDSTHDDKRTKGLDRVEL